MARGWESKAVDDQQAAAEERRQAPKKPQLTDAERARQAQRETLLLARAKIVQDLAVAADERYRAMLQRVLAHLDAEIAGV